MLFHTIPYHTRAARSTTLSLWSGSQAAETSEDSTSARVVRRQTRASARREELEETETEAEGGAAAAAAAVAAAAAMSAEESKFWLTHDWSGFEWKKMLQLILCATSSSEDVEYVYRHLYCTTYSKRHTVPKVVMLTKLEYIGTRYIFTLQQRTIY